MCDLAIIGWTRNANDLYKKHNSKWVLWTVILVFWEEYDSFKMDDSMMLKSRPG